MAKTMAEMAKGNCSSIAIYLGYLLVFGGFLTDALPYDYTSIVDCVAEPHRPQYNGGIIVNPELNDGLRGWTTFGDAKIERRQSDKGNKYIVAHTRKHPHDSMSQKLVLQKDMFYTLSAWIQVSAKTNVEVTAVFKTNEGFKHAGGVIAKAGCWSMIKGGVSVDSSGPAELYFESDDMSVDIWVDSVSLQPFTKEEWRAHQHQSIEKVLKSNVKLQILDTQGNPLQNENIYFRKYKLGFPFGVAINKNILTNTAYRSWFTSRFTVTTFENEMKWYSTEGVQGKEDYSVADAMFRFCTLHGIFVRGHNIFWDDPQYQPNWVSNLSPNDLRSATEKRLNSIVPRYAGKLIGWDVNNEILHFNFFENKLGLNITAHFYQKTNQLDGRTKLYINDFNTIEDGRDKMSTPSKFLQKIKEVQGVLGSSSIGIGLEGHFDTPNIPYMRSVIDTLASSGLPIWITELDVRGSNQAKYLEQILREAHAHPAIKGIVIWSAWSPQGCYRMCLTDNNFANLETGNVVDKLLAEWGQGHAIYGTTDAHGYFNASLFHGDYKVKLVDQSITLLDNEEFSSFNSQSFKVVDDLLEQHVKVIL